MKLIDFLFKGKENVELKRRIADLEDSCSKLRAKLEGYESPAVFIVHGVEAVNKVRASRAVIESNGSIVLYLGREGEIWGNSISAILPVGSSVVRVDSIV